MKPYHRPPTKAWWFKRRGYALFMLREVTCIFVALYAGLVLYGLVLLRRDEVAYRDYVDALTSNDLVLLHLFGFVFAALHSITWFMATPKAVAVRIGEDRVPDHQVIGGNVAIWFVATAGIVWLFCF